MLGLLDCWTIGLLNIQIFQKKLSLSSIGLGLLDSWMVGLLNILMFQKNLKLFRAWTVGLLAY